MANITLLLMFATTFTTLITFALVTKVWNCKHNRVWSYGGSLPGKAPSEEIGCVQVAAKLEDAYFY